MRGGARKGWGRGPRIQRANREEEEREIEDGRIKGQAGARCRYREKRM